MHSITYVNSSSINYEHDSGDAHIHVPPGPGNTRNAQRYTIIIPIVFLNYKLQLIIREYNKSHIAQLCTIFCMPGTFKLRMS